MVTLLQLQIVLISEIHIIQNLTGNLLRAIKGMSAACEKFKTPVTGGNVSFYNQSVIDGNEGAGFSNSYNWDAWCC